MADETKPRKPTDLNPKDFPFLPPADVRDPKLYSELPDEAREKKEKKDS